MRTIEDFVAELVCALDVNKGIDFLVGIKVRHAYLGEGTIVGVNNEWDTCTVKFLDPDRWLEFTMDEFAVPEYGWDFNLKRLDEIFEPHMLQSVLQKMRRRPSGHITES